MWARAIGVLLLRRVHAGEADPDRRFGPTERVFVILQIMTACAVAFAHGSNDVANAIGPLAAIVSAVNEGIDVAGKSPVQPWMLAVGGIAVGLATGGYRVMKTMRIADGLDG